MQKLQLLDSGNLVLVDAQQKIKWQTFNFPTDVLLLGQRLSVATRLMTSFPTNNNNNYTTTPYFSFEIHHDKVALYLNSGSTRTSDHQKVYKYSYWEFEPSEGRNITYIELASKGLELFDDKFQNFSQILSPRLDQVRFLALDNATGNLGFYYYSPYNDRFEVSFQVLNRTCDLPLACSPYGICTFSNTCSCIRLLTKENKSDSDCTNQVEMLELENAASVLNNATSVTNISKTECGKSCLTSKTSCPTCFCLPK